jgi:hypothetical protein
MKETNGGGRSDELTHVGIYSSSDSLQRPLGHALLPGRDRRSRAAGIAAAPSAICATTRRWSGPCPSPSLGTATSDGASADWGSSFNHSHPPCWSGSGFGAFSADLGGAL